MGGWFMVLLLVLVTVCVCVFFVLWWGWWVMYKVRHRVREPVEVVWKDNEVQDKMMDGENEESFGFREK